MHLRNEAELTNPVAMYLRRKGYRLQATELQFYDYRIDIYGFSRVSDLTVSVELKVKDWRRAFQQALVYQLCSDLVFMALPKETVHRVDRSMLETEGIGLIVVAENNRCRMILDPRVSCVMSDSYKRHNIDMLRRTRSRANARS